MRSDVKTLLDRLGRSQFRYKEFADRFSELETWPVFEAVIRDPRVFESNVTNTMAVEAQPEEPAPIASILSRKYGSVEDVKPAAKSNDVRGLLAKIASAAEKGMF